MKGKLFMDGKIIIVKKRSTREDPVFDDVKPFFRLKNA